ncbi:MAG: hypothetical protein RI964_1942 [Pseudomonadota bacterium]|jgi:hypothetical protein
MKNLLLTTLCMAGLSACSTPSSSTTDTTPAIRHTFTGDGLVYIPDGAAAQSTSQKFVTREELSSHYQGMTGVLATWNPEADAALAIREQRFYLIGASYTDYSSRSVVGGIYPSIHEPDLTFIDINDRSGVEKACPTHYIETDWLSQIDEERIKRILRKQEAQPNGTLLKTFTPEGLLNTGVNEIPGENNFSLAALHYAQRWNKLMLSSCMKRAGTPDLNNVPPIKVTHKVVGDSLFILDEPPFRNPRNEVMSGKARAIYNIRLHQAMQQKNPEQEAKAALERGEYYLMGDKSVWHVDLPPGSFKNYAGVRGGVNYQPDIENLSTTERDALQKVCPVRVMEGREDIRRGNVGNVVGDGNTYAYDSVSINSPVNQDYRQMTQELGQTMTAYGVRWNNIMLPACRAKLPNIKEK